MTDENKRYNLELELTRAKARQSDAQTLLQSGSYDGAVSAAYYAAFHYARSLLLMEGLETRTHGGLMHMISRHFVRTGRMSPESADALAQLQKRRENAEYDAASVFTEDMARNALAQSADFANAARRLLVENKFLSE